MIEEEIIEVPAVEYGDLHLKFTDEAEATQVLEGYTGSVDVIGVIYKPTGETLQGEDGPYPEMKPVSGWHVNTRGEMPEALKAYAVEVNSPVRVWA
jgi:hypothetical protein